MKTETPFLDFYNEHSKDDTLSGGLCRCFFGNETLELFEPTAEDKAELKSEGSRYIWWGSPSYAEDIFKFTSLRKTVVLFCAALNNEL